MLINLYENGILSIRSVNGSPVPNLFMPPLYPIFLYGLKLVFLKNEIFIDFYLYFSYLFSLIAVYFFYLTVVLYFNKKISFNRHCDILFLPVAYLLCFSNFINKSSGSLFFFIPLWSNLFIKI